MATLNVELTATIASITVTPEATTLTSLGATQQFTAVARDASGAVIPGVPFTWSSSAQGVSTIDPASGLATAVGHGATTIVASAGSVSGSASLIVNLTASIKTIVVSPELATLTAIGATQQFTAVARDVSGAVLPGVQFQWSSSATDVATIDAVTGLAVAVCYGTTTVTATVGDEWGTATLDVVQVGSAVVGAPSRTRRPTGSRPSTGKAETTTVLCP